jgi:hypothetical protein
LALCRHKAHATYPCTPAEKHLDEQPSFREDAKECIYLVLLHAGFTEPQRLPAMLVGSYPTVSPLPPLPQAKPERIGGLLSVALSVGSHLLGAYRLPVRKRIALWSSDFPHRSIAMRLPAFLIK